MDGCSSDDTAGICYLFQQISYRPWRGGGVKGLACPSFRAAPGRNGAAAAANGFIQYFPLPPKCHAAVHLRANTTVNLTEGVSGDTTIPRRRPNAGGEGGGEEEEERDSPIFELQIYEALKAQQR